VDPAAVLSYVPHVVILVALIVFAAKRRTWGRPALFGVGYYLAALFPVLGFFDIYYHRFSYVADHFQYLPMVGLIALAVHAIAHGLDKLGAAKMLSADNTKAAGQALTIVALVACGYLTWQRAAVFQSSERLCHDTLQKNPDSWIAHHKLGECLQRRYARDPNQLLAAMQHFRRALELQPEHPHVLEGLGNTLRLLQRDADALPYLRRAVDADPDNAIFRVNLGAVLERMRQLPEAITHYEQAVRSRPDLPAARASLGQALLRAGKPTDAIPHLREAVRLDPNDSRSASLLRHAEPVP
jgi:tetratricopeptide (TPR) repeat protein